MGIAEVRSGVIMSGNPENYGSPVHSFAKVKHRAGD